jgi:hypothetical protein
MQFTTIYLLITTKDQPPFYVWFATLQGGRCPAYCREKYNTDVKLSFDGTQIFFYYLSQQNDYYHTNYA